MAHYDIDIASRNHLLADNSFISHKVAIEWGPGASRNLFVLIVNGDGLNFDDVMKRMAAVMNICNIKKIRFAVD